VGWSSPGAKNGAKTGQPSSTAQNDAGDKSSLEVIKAIAIWRAQRFSGWVVLAREDNLLRGRYALARQHLIAGTD